MIKYNADAIVGIKISDKEFFSNIIHVPEKKWLFGLLKQKERDYSYVDGDIYRTDLSEYLEIDGFMVDGKKLYVKPLVQIMFVNNKYNFTKYFNTYEEALEYSKKYEEKISDKIVL